jgi:kumamolisin
MAAAKDNMTHIPLKGSRRYLRAGSEVLSRSDSNEQVGVTVKIRRKAPLPEPVPGKPISRAVLMEKYGADPADLEKVANILSTYGLTIASKNPAARSLQVTGPASAMEKAFGVHLFQVKHNDLLYRGRVGDINIPTPLEGIVTGVFGLDNRPMIKRRHPMIPQAIQNALPSPDSRSWYLPQELAEAYKFPDGDGAGQSIGILEFAGQFLEADLSTFLQLAGQGSANPNVQIKNVHHLSAAETSNADATGEVMLDVEIIASLCPKAAITIYFAHWSERGWIANLDAVLTDAPSVLSISYGLAEGDDIWTAQAITSVNDTLKELANAGIAVCVSSGDDGSDDQVPDGKAHIDFPATSPYVLSVGGTALTRATGKEVVWFDGDGLRRDNGGSTGGGVSGSLLRPAWQNFDIASVNPHTLTGRIVPDVAANAAGSTGYLMVSQGQGMVSGGTSAATPLWAGLLARLQQAGKTVGYFTPRLYQPTSKTNGKPLGAVACRDITEGSNAAGNAQGYSAGPGFDAVTGWGSPIGQKLMASLD